MDILSITPISENIYFDLVYKLLVDAEESGVVKTRVYADGKGIPTIGIGFNLRVSANVEAILETMYSDQWEGLNQEEQSSLVSDFVSLAKRTWKANSESGKFTEFESEALKLLNNETYDFGVEKFEFGSAEFI